MADCRPRWRKENLIYCPVLVDHYTPETIAEANGAIRQLIEAVRLVPKGESLQIELFGELAALLKLSEEPKTNHPLAETEGVQVTMVAGAGFEPTTFGL